MNYINHIFEYLVRTAKRTLFFLLTCALRIVTGLSARRTMVRRRSIKSTLYAFRHVRYRRLTHHLAFAGYLEGLLIHAAQGETDKGDSSACREGAQW